MTQTKLAALVLQVSDRVATHSGNSGSFQVEENLRETKGDSGNFYLLFKLRETQESFDFSNKFREVLRL